MDPLIARKLDQLLTASLAEFFAQAKVRLHPVASDESRADYAALVNFSGAQVSGMGGIGMRLSTLDQLMATHDRGHRHGNQDWLRETANQVVGRFKGKLLRHGLSILPGLPNIVTGTRLRSLCDKAGPCRKYTFDTSAGRVFAWLEARLQPGVDLRELNLGASLPPNEGALLLF